MNQFYLNGTKGHLDERAMARSQRCNVNTRFGDKHCIQVLKGDDFVGDVVMFGRNHFLRFCFKGVVEKNQMLFG